MKRVAAILANTAVLVVTVGLCWLGVNAWLYCTRAIDVRPAIAVLADEWPKDENTMLFIAPQNYVRGDVHPAFQDMLPPGVSMPLGGVPDIRSIYCQEDEGWYIERTDRHGFFNPNSAWDRPIDILLVGDSFANGACTEKNSRFHLARHANTVTIGSGGNGPLLELAVLREFLLTHSARHVVWYVYENDLSDLALELAHPPLRAYYDDPTHAQRYFELDLSPWRERVLGATPNYLALNAGNIAYSRTHIRSPFQDIVTGRYFFPLMSEIAGAWAAPTPTPSTVVDEGVMAAFDEILRRAHSAAQQAGSKLTFVFLPSKKGCIEKRPPEHFASLMRGLKGAGIDHLDAQAVMQEDGCAKLFATRAGGHFTAYGYRRLADFVLSHVGYEAPRP